MRVGLDIGGTKVELIKLSEDGKIVHRERIPTSTHSYSEFLNAITQLIIRCNQKGSTTKSVGLGCPGAISPDTGKIKNANCQILNGQNLAEDLAAQIQLPVKMANDADCLALSEFKDGAALRAKSSCFAAILGTGCGGGVVVNGQLVTGVNRIAGEWGHNALPDWSCSVDGPATECYCGRHHCQESYISGTGLARNYHQIYGDLLSAPEIIAQSRAGNPQAISHMNLFYDQLARSLASIINILDPEVIVIGGGLSNIDEIYEEVPKLWGKYVFSDHVHTQLSKAKHGDSSGVRGAAWL